MPYHHILEYRYLWGGRTSNRRRLFLVMPFCNTECVNVLLHELFAAYPDEDILVAIDGASWHNINRLHMSLRFDREGRHDLTEAAVGFNSSDAKV